MANARHDDNGIPTLLAVLATNGTSTVAVTGDPVTNTISISDGTTGTDHGPVNALRDENDVPSLLAVSSADGFTPVVVYANADGSILIQST